MKRVIPLLLCLLALTGCVQLPVEDIAEVRLVGDEGVIYAPKINNMPLGYEACVQAGDKILLDFNPGRDQYGNKTGFSSSRYTLDQLSIQCELKNEPDTIFEDKSDTNVYRLSTRIWFPCWTAPVELISGLPIPYSPLTGYPWDSCRTVGIPAMPAQQATVRAVARASWIEVEFVLPEQDGTYQLEGQSWTSSNVIKIMIDEPGLYTVVHSGGEVYEFDVPIDWFFIEGEWPIDVGPVGVCG